MEAISKHFPYGVSFALLTLVVVLTNLDKEISLILTWVFVAALAYFFIFAFTQSLGAPTETMSAAPPISEEEAKGNFNKLLLMLRAGYFFMILTLGICIVPFVAPNVMFEYLTSGEQHNGPFQIVIGCADGKPAEVPISCDNESSSPQWLVSLGASKSNPVWPGQADIITALQRQLIAVQTTTQIFSVLKPENPDVVAITTAFAKVKEAVATLNTSIEADAARLNVIYETLQTSQSSMVNFVAASEILLASLQSATDGEENVDELNRIAKEFETIFQPALTTLQSLMDQTIKDKKIAKLKGGLVVPFFVIVLSLLGGSISMTRKLPEIQLRAAPRYEKFYFDRVRARTEGKLQTPLIAVQARDFILFQILQVVTAPFLAMVVYSSFEVKSTAAAVLIGFGAGFASEPLLLRLRKAIDRLAELDPEKDAENVRNSVETAPEAPELPTPDDAAAIAVNTVRQSATVPTSEPAN